jgi:hypothetical protein
MTCNSSATVSTASTTSMTHAAMMASTGSATTTSRFRRRDTDPGLLTQQQQQQQQSLPVPNLSPMPSSILKPSRSIILNNSGSPFHPPQLTQPPPNPPLNPPPNPPNPNPTPLTHLGAPSNPTVEFMPRPPSSSQAWPHGPITAAPNKTRWVGLRV